jgi:serine phosphatase RsbU (regulator of sigma subunit)
MSSRPLDAKFLYKQIAAVFSDLRSVRSPERTAERIVESVLDVLASPLGLRSAHLYRRRADTARLLRSWREERSDLSSELPRWLSSSGDDGILELPWVGRTTNGMTGLLAFDPERTLLGAFYRTADDADSQATAMLSAALSALDYGVEQHRHRRRYEDVLEQSRAIQMSLLPPGRPAFADYDIAAVSIPAETVGGDLYDFQSLDPDTLLLTVADSSGHGLPAALQARDVAIGIRMGAERDFKINRMLEKLNRVIHRSGIATRFISVISGELETNGNFSYVNAGHPPALLADDSGVRELAVGGTVLGPVADGSYKLGFAHVDRGAMLLLYSDGVIERGADSGDMFGMPRLKKWLEKWRGRSAADAVEDLVAKVKAFRTVPLEDDVTVMVIQRPAERPTS